VTHRTSRTGRGLRILVVGAGIAGLGAARALRQRGFVAEVVESESAWTHAGAGIYLPGNAARALRALGLQSPVVERGSLITRQRLCDHHGRVLADIDVSALLGEVGPCVALHRADLHEVLASHGDPVLVRMGQPVRQLTQHDNTVTVGFGDATADCYDLVIGADGIHSTVRQLAVGVCNVRPGGSLPGASSPSARRTSPPGRCCSDATSPFWPCRSAGARSTATATPPSAPLDHLATT
jgi:FAD-dependent urate hydroxylase